MGVREVCYDELNDWTGKDRRFWASEYLYCTTLLWIMEWTLVYSSVHVGKLFSTGFRATWKLNKQTKHPLMPWTHMVIVQELNYSLAYQTHCTLRPAAPDHWPVSNSSVHRC